MSSIEQLPPLGPSTYTYPPSSTTNAISSSPPATATYVDHPTTTSSLHTATSSGPPFIPIFAPEDSSNFWNKLANGSKAAVVIAALIGIVAIVFFSMWFCCGCCGGRARCCGKKRRIPDRESGPENQSVPLYTVQRPARVGAPAPVGEEAPPPRYEEAVPPRHQTIAGGITHVREEEEGVVADGKTPLSEIPFEDVVLDHSPSEGSSRSFAGRHHALGGDTRGHTNS